MRVIVITNPAAGDPASGSADEIKAALLSAGVQCEVRSAAGDELTAAARQAAGESVDAVVASGGDGTVSAVAAALVGSSVPLGVLPTGSLNHFARDLKLPLDVKEAARVIAQRLVREVDVGEVNGRFFINNSSIGLYPSIVIKRDEIRTRLGRGKWIAMLAAVLAVFRRCPTVAVRLKTDGGALARTTPFVFIGNNRYEVSLNKLGGRSALDRHELCVYLTSRTGRFGLLRLALRALFGRLEQSRDFHSLDTHEVWIDAPRRSLRVSLDGEVVPLNPPLHYQIRPGALRVLAAPAGAARAS